MRIRPLGSRLLVKPHEPEGEVRSKGGILIPKMAQERPQEGTVIAAGPGHRENGVFVHTTISVGEVVFYGKYAGMEVKVGDITHLIMHEDDVLGVVEPERGFSDAGCVPGNNTVQVAA